MNETTVKQRLVLFAKSKEKSVRAFEKKVGFTIGYVNAIRVSIQPDKIKRIASYYPDINTAWLLTGEGEMLRNPYLEKANDIVSDIEYKSPNFDHESLLRIGIRVSEVARIYKLSLQELADRIDMDYEELMAVANADQSATPALIIKLAAAFPGLNPYWLSTGESAPLIKDVLPELTINDVPEKLAAAEKQLKEKEWIISLQADTITSLKKQAKLLEEKIATLQYAERISAKNAVSSKEKVAGDNARDITLG